MSAIETKKDFGDAKVTIDEASDDGADSYAELKGWRKVLRGSLFNIFVLSALSFCGPAMSDAIGGLGGGGLAVPFLSNLATSTGYATSCLVTLCGGPLINRLGIKTCCIIAASFFWVNAISYYVNLRFKVDWFLVFAKSVGGIFYGMLYVSESTAMLSYPLPSQRGLFLSIWVSARNSGVLVGGIIALANNIKNAGAGAIASSTYLIFFAFELVGFPIAFLLSPQTKVRRVDGSKVAAVASQSWKYEFTMVYRHLLLKRTLLMIIPYAYSFFYGGVFSTYLGLHFSVRARALSSFVVPSSVIITTFIYGQILDLKRFGQRTRAWIGFACFMLPSIAAFAWLTVEMYKFRALPASLRLDFKDPRWASAYIPFLIMQCCGYWCQTYMYWLLGCFATDTAANSRSGGLMRAFETMGQAISYGINSNTGDKRIPLFINLGLAACMIPCQIATILLVPDVPAERDEVEDLDEALPPVVGFSAA